MLPREVKDFYLVKFLDGSYATLRYDQLPANWQNPLIQHGEVRMHYWKKTRKEYKACCVWIGLRKVCDPLKTLLRAKTLTLNDLGLPEFPEEENGDNTQQSGTLEKKFFDIQELLATLGLSSIPELAEDEDEAGDMAEEDIAEVPEMAEEDEKEEEKGEILEVRHHSVKVVVVKKEELTEEKLSELRDREASFTEDGSESDGEKKEEAAIETPAQSGKRSRSAQAHGQAAAKRSKKSQEETEQIDSSLDDMPCLEPFDGAHEDALPPTPPASTDGKVPSFVENRLLLERAPASKGTKQGAISEEADERFLAFMIGMKAKEVKKEMVEDVPEDTPSEEGEDSLVEQRVENLAVDPFLAPPADGGTPTIPVEEPQPNALLGAQGGDLEQTPIGRRAEGEAPNLVVPVLALPLPTDLVELLRSIQAQPPNAHIEEPREPSDEAAKREEAPVDNPAEEVEKTPEETEERHGTPALPISLDQALSDSDRDQKAANEAFLVMREMIERRKEVEKKAEAATQKWTVLIQKAEQSNQRLIDLMNSKVSSLAQALQESERDQKAANEAFLVMREMIERRKEVEKKAEAATQKWTVLIQKAEQSNQRLTALMSAKTGGANVA